MKKQCSESEVSDREKKDFSNDHVKIFDRSECFRKQEHVEIKSRRRKNICSSLNDRLVRIFNVKFLPKQ